MSISKMLMCDSCYQQIDIDDFKNTEWQREVGHDVWVPLGYNEIDEDDNHRCPRCAAKARKEQ